MRDRGTNKWAVRVAFLALLISLTNAWLVGAYRKGTLALGDAADVVWDSGNSRISFTIGGAEVAHLSATTLTMTNASGVIVVDKLQADNIEDEAGSGTPDFTYGIQFAANQDLKLSGTGAVCTDHIKDAAEVANMDLSGANLTQKGNVTLDNAASVLKADQIQGDKYTDEAGSGTPSLTYGAVAAINQDLAISGTGAFKGGNVEDAAGVTAMTLSGANVTAKGNVTLDAVASVLYADSVYTDNIEDEAGSGAPTVQHSLNVTGNVDASGTVYGDIGCFDNLKDEAGSAAPNATYGVVAAVNQDFVASGTGAFKGDHIEDAAGVAAMDLSGADVTGKGNFTLDAAAGILQADKVYTDNIADEAGNAAATLSGANISAMGTFDVAGVFEAKDGVRYSKQTVVAVGDSPYTVLASDFCLLVDNSGGDVELDFPVTDGHLWNVKLTSAPGSNVVTMDPASGTVDGAAYNDTFFGAQYDDVHVYADGTNLHLK